MTAGYGTAWLSPQSGTQDRYVHVPCPSALWSFHDVQVIFETTFVASPLKTITTGSVPRNVPTTSTGTVPVDGGALSDLHRPDRPGAGSAAERRQQQVGGTMGEIGTEGLDARPRVKGPPEPGLVEERGQLAGDG